MDIPKFLIYVDVDGVMTPCRKLMQCVQPKTKGMPDTRWYKEFSDRDSFVMMRLQEQLVFISHDKRNKHFCNYKKHKFVYAPHSAGDKFNVLLQDWKHRIENKEVRGNPNDPTYVYLGDAPFDWQCLLNSKHGFVPSDSSSLLLTKMKMANKKHIETLKAPGGAGCLEEAILRLHASGAYLKDKIFKKEDGKVIKVFDDIEKYLGSMS